MKPKKVYLMVGVPGSGKSTWVQKKMKTDPGVWCSRDAVRFSMLEKNDDYFGKENLVFQKWIENINQAIANPKVENIYIDATHLTPQSRNNTLSLLDKNIYELEIIPVAFDLPLEVCILRNEKRTGRALVPRSVIRKMYHQFVMPTYNEKFHYKNIIVIRKKGDI